MARRFYTYIMTNKRHTVLYTGMTNNLRRGLDEHRHPVHRCFTKRYNVTTLVYFEVFASPSAAIRREKQIKAGPRRKKVELIENTNPVWADLTDQIPLWSGDASLA